MTITSHSGATWAAWRISSIPLPPGRSRSTSSTSGRVWSNYLPALLEIGGHAHQTDVRRFLKGMGEGFAETKLILDDQDAEK